MIQPIEQYDGFNISFHVTEDCNLRCKYCYELEKKKNDLPLEYAKRFIELIIDDPDPVGVKGTKEEYLLNKGLILDFIGGDALMKPDLCEEIIKYFIFYSTLKNHRWSKNWRISISTNGTLFNDRVKEFLMKWKDVISLGISIDGCPEIHNLNRSGSMPAIMKEWNWYYKFTNGNPTTKATLTNESIPYIYESVTFLHEVLKINYIYMNFIFEKQETEPDLVELGNQLELTCQYVLKHQADLYLSLFDKDMKNGKPMQDPDKGWCGSGAMPCLDIDGKIYPCFRFCSQNMSKGVEPLVVGDIEKGLYNKEVFSLIRSKTRGVISEEKCMNCDVESSCAWCIAGGYGETGELCRQTYICEVNKVQDKWAKEYWRLYNGINR